MSSRVRRLRAAAILVSGLALLAASPVAGPALAQQRAALKTNKEKASYIIGMNIGRSLRNDGVEIDMPTFLQGLQDSLAKLEPQLSAQEMRDVMTQFQKELQVTQEARAKSAGERNKKEGDAFLAKNKSQQGVKTTATGLQYKVVKEGTGKAATLADTVTANYRGTLIDGTEFDSSYKRGEPAKFPVTGVIPGWTEVLQLMKVGSKVQVYIPAHLAYGERGAGPQIGPNATLIFEIELLDAKQE
jgi:FKBP-type peptidyl-prolyl cis-trans isomerase FklB